MGYNKEYRRKRYLLNRGRELAQDRIYQQGHRGQKRAYQRQWYEIHKDELRIKSRERDRRHTLYLKSTGKPISVPIKRPRPNANGNCELCSKQPKRLIYHHWTDEHPEWGMWLCTLCHQRVEWIEQGKGDNYITLKSQIVEDTKRLL